MHFKVRLLRVRGRRLPWREVLNGPEYEGDLQTYEINIRGHLIRAAKLSPADPAAATRMPVLYEPVLALIATQAMRLRGIERLDGPDGAFSVVQEWHCEMP